jgi:long-subunit fatty acid transport protein
MSKNTLIAALAILLCLPVFAFGQAKVGTAGAQFLKIGVSARSAGMGDAFIGVANDASALYYNPAGIANLENREIAATHIEYPADIQYEFIGLVWPTPQWYGAIGLATYWLHTDDMLKTDYRHPRGTGQTFSAADMAMAFTYGASLTDHLSIGLSFKYINQLLETERAHGWATDAGIYYQTGYRDFKLCMMLANFGPDMKFIEETYPLPMDFRFGSSINIIQSDMNKLTFALQASRPNDNLERFNGGLEYWYNDMFALRVGKKFNYDFGKNGFLQSGGFDDRQSFSGLTSGITFGGGIKVPVSSYALQVDYAYQDMGFLDTVHRVTLDLKF